MVTSISSSNGLESILKPDQIISRASEPGNMYQLPVNMYHHLRLIKFSVYSGKVMSENVDNPSGLPNEIDRFQIMDRLGVEFEDLKTDVEVNATSKFYGLIHYCEKKILTMGSSYQSIHMLLAITATRLLLFRGNPSRKTKRRPS